MSGAFDRKTIVVTGGAGGGIGGGVSRGLAEEGAEVVIVDIDESGRERASELGGRFVAADLTDPGAGAANVAVSVDQIHGLVNCAGTLEGSRFPELGVDDWERVLSVNAAAPLFLIQALFDRFVEGSAVVNVTSLEERLPMALRPPLTTPIYAASKAALGLLTRSLAPVLGTRGIRINSIAPGYVHTPLSAPLRETAEPWTAAQTPLRRWAQPDEIADAVLFLLSDDARFITGASLRVDGGFALGPQRAWHLVTP
jgi:3-oxoacyl-[acyl-carrier protein] reductase